MKCLSFVSAAAFCLATLSAGCNRSTAYEKAERELTRVSAERDRLRAELSQSSALVGTLQREVEGLRADVAKAAKPAAAPETAEAAPPDTGKKKVAKKANGKRAGRKSGGKKR